MIHNLSMEIRSIETIVKALNDAKVKYLVVEGLAVAQEIGRSVSGFGRH